MFLEERRAQILSIMDKNERMTVNELSIIFSISKETIRYDLSEMAQKGLVERCHGGARIIRKSFQSTLNQPHKTGCINKHQKPQIDISTLLKKLENKQITTKKVIRKKGHHMTGKVCILGSFNVDIVAKVERFPKKGESIMALNSIIGPGGKGTNQATAASNANAEVHFFCKVGKDHFSQFAYDLLAASKIHTFTLYQSETEPTGNAIIYVSQTDAENMIAIHSGANITITDDEVMEMESSLSQADVLLVQLENNFDATFNVMKLAKSLGVTIILNPAPYSDVILPALPYIDIITPNETEASLMSGIEIHDLESAQKAAQLIASKGIKIVIITMGSQGVLIYEQNKFRHIPAFAANSIDTTGAGDAFNGALASSISLGKSIDIAARYASGFASLAVEREGASNMPTHEMVLARLVQKQV